VGAALRSNPRRLVLLGLGALVVVVVVALLAARALSGSGTGSDPANVVPPNAAVYAYAQLDPGGEAGASVRHVLGHVVGDGDDPGPRLRSLADTVLGRVGLSWDRDIEPWVGGRAGVFVTRFAPGFEGALVATAADEAEARRVLARTGRPFVVANGVAAVGTAGAVAGVRRAAEGGISLGSSLRYAAALASRESPVAVLYVDLAHLVDALPASLLGAERRRDLRLRFARIEDKPIAVSMTGVDNRIALDFGSPPSAPDPSAPPPVGGGQRGTSLLPTRLIYSVPAQSWLAIDLPELGQRLFETLSPAVNPGLPSDALRALQRRIARETGLRPIEDVVRWMGGTTLFAYGADPARLTLGLLIESLDPSGSQHALVVLRRWLERQPGVRVRALPPATGGGGYAVRAPGLAAPVSVLARGNRIAVVYGRGDPAAALDAPVKLGDLPAFRETALQLGGSLLPSGWLVVPQAARFAEATALAQSPLFQAALPYLERIAYAQLGVKRAKRRVLVGVR
jgi:hypothetical protein